MREFLDGAGADCSRGRTLSVKHVIFTETHNSRVWWYSDYFKVMINGSYLEVGLLADVTSENNIWIQEVSHHDLLAWQCAYISWCKDEGWKYIYVELYLAYCSSFYFIIQTSLAKLISMFVVLKLKAKNNSLTVQIFFNLQISPLSIPRKGWSA